MFIILRCKFFGSYVKPITVHAWNFILSVLKDVILAFSYVLPYFLYWTVFTCLEICRVSPSLIMEQHRDLSWTLFHGFYFGIVLLPCCGNSPEMACLSSSALPVSFKYNPIGPRSHRPCAYDFPDFKSASTWPNSSFPHCWLCCVVLFSSTFSSFSWFLSFLTFSSSRIFLISAFWGGHNMLRVCSYFLIFLLRFFYS